MRRGKKAGSWRGSRLAGLIVLAACCGIAPAEVVVHERAEFYHVQGSTLQQLRDQLANRELSGHRGTHASGLTAVSMTWEAGYEDVAGGCRVRSHRVELELTTTLPRWDGRARAKRRLRSQWDRAVAALAAHEDEHRALAVAAAQALDRLIAGFRTEHACIRAPNELAWRVWKLKMRSEREHERLDRITDHGRRRGSVL
jgi:predicted secreted Zn-dependent protease